MAASDSVPLHALAENNLATVSTDLLRAMVKPFADALMSAGADAFCNAEYGQVGDVRSATNASTTATETAHATGRPAPVPSNSPPPNKP